MQLIAAKPRPGDHSTYIATFGQIPCKEASLSDDDWLGYFLGTLSLELRQLVTKHGTVHHEDWRAAAADLATLAEPWRNEEAGHWKSVAEIHQYLPEDTWRSGPLVVPRDVNARIEPPPFDGAGVVCIGCKGRGQEARECPSASPRAEREG
ncbi:hypothetical protein EMWEY_00007420 [Eimeria maxima]|uniref:Uncharacterized protein n=1 Tax=Eimeria maxima TaxID=5804 RepID=U6M4A5_EIMMA|nr:hypothetical protein EMWEY_00007420 [Eimeria maxima]CDJ57279.1 hypothetical protein EMWEY_00007420 [Eimeria maxima]